MDLEIYKKNLKIYNEWFEGKNSNNEVGNLSVYERYPHLSLVADKLENSKLVSLATSGKYYFDEIPNSIQKCIDTGMQVSSLRKIDEKKTISIVAIFINTVNENYNGNINLEMCSRQICSVFWYMKIEEIAFVIKNGIIGKYGKVYGSINISDVMGWLTGYDIEERASHCSTHGEKYKERNENVFREMQLRDIKSVQENSKKEYQWLVGKRKAKMKFDKKFNK